MTSGYRIVATRLRSTNQLITEYETMKNVFWVIESGVNGGDFEPANHGSSDKKTAIKEMEGLKIEYPDLKFRVKKYAPC